MRKGNKAKLPGGTVTFLISDIEDSTGHSRRLGDDGYGTTLRVHDRVLREAVEANGGSFVNDTGDGVLFVFSSARSAIAATVAGQRALRSAPWPLGVALRVRMGVHTGEGEPISGKYTCSSVPLASRVCGWAQGQQVLVSEETRGAAGESLPFGVSLLPIGPKPLKGFDGTTMLYKVCHPDLPEPAEPLPTPVQAATDSADSGRTPGTPPGTFRVLGEFHVHVDGCENPRQTFERLADADNPALTDQTRFPRKYNRILRFSGGPQREDKDFVQTYRHHTPGTAAREHFASFSTIRLGRGRELEPDAVAMLAHLLDAVADETDAVVELERVIGVLEHDGSLNEEPRIADPTSLHHPSLDRFQRLTTSGIEIHHTIDIAKTEGCTDEPPISVDDLPDWPNRGGWFLFQKEDCWSYRSSEFVDRSNEYQYAAYVGHRRLHEFLQHLGHEYTLRTLIEQVLGIWRGGEQRATGSASIADLSAWEMAAPPDSHVWVIAANFLGDSSPDVSRAMLQNLGERVTYTYFLHTHADVLRLGSLSDELEHRLIEEGTKPDRAERIMSEQLRCVLVSAELAIDPHLRRLLRDDYFLCPYDESMGGYRLDGVSGEQISTEDLSYIVDALQPLLDAKVRGLLVSPEEAWKATSSSQAVVCTNLEESAVDQEQGPWLKMLANYDRIVAREVSMHGGTCVVVRPVRNGYLLVFEQTVQAASWAKRVQFEVTRYNEQPAMRSGRGQRIPSHNIALGFGPVSRVLRAHGYDYIGGAIDDCIDLAERLQTGVIAMSGSFADQYEKQVGKREFGASTATPDDLALVGCTSLEWP